jgi:hypothetical protein
VLALLGALLAALDALLTTLDLLFAALLDARRCNRCRRSRLLALLEARCCNRCRRRRLLALLEAARLLLGAIDPALLGLTLPALARFRSWRSFDPRC